MPQVIKLPPRVHHLVGENSLDTASQTRKTADTSQPPEKTPLVRPLGSEVIVRSSIRVRLAALCRAIRFRIYIHHI